MQWGYSGRLQHVDRQHVRRQWVVQTRYLDPYWCYNINVEREVWTAKVSLGLHFLFHGSASEVGVQREAE